MNNAVTGSAIDSSTHTILVVDDLPATRYSTSRTLQAAGFNTTVATCGEEALNTNLDGISAVVLDVHLPDIDGFEVCRRWRVNPATSTVPVIHLSAHFVDDRDKVNGLNSGADAYLTHPADPAVLVATIRTLIRARMAEDQVHKNEEKLRLAVEAADIGLWDLDVVRDILFWPPRIKAMFGISENDPVTMADFFAGLHPDDRDATTIAFSNACDPTLRTQYDVEFRTIGRDDPIIRWVAAKGRAVFDASDRCVRVVGTAIEITSRKASEMALQDSEERLRLSDRRKDEFLAMLAHELRNPLAPISAAAQLIRLTNLNAAQLRNTSEIISRQVNHLNDLLEDLLDVSRVTRGLITLKKHAIDMNDVVASAVEQIRPAMEARKHRLEIEVPPRPTTVLGDHARLVQVTTNLLSNAARYTPLHGHIRLTLAVADERVVLQVSDNGIGITDELSAQVFELFTQAERSADRSQGGLGLGLALVKHLVELQSGTVSCQSPGAGQGSCFTISLPLYNTDLPLVIEGGSEQHDVERFTKVLRILVVDDNVDAASTLSMLLQNFGHDVFTENDSIVALDRITQDPPDVVLLDIGLPEMDGYELARRLRALDSARPPLTLIAVTGYGHDEDRKKAQAAGFDHHLTKPVDVAVLNKVLAATTFGDQPH